MKGGVKMKSTKIVKVVLAVAVVLVPTIVWAQSAGSAFTYQGQLKHGGMPADGLYDFQFSLWNDPTSTDPHDQIGTTLTEINQPVTNGLFSIELDFGAGAFTGDARFLEIAVRLGHSGAEYTTLTPRQKLTPTPYASTALKTVGVDGYSLDAADGSPVNAVYVDSAGNVGVGTTSPDQKLDVAGTAKMTGFQLGEATTLGHVLTADANGVGTWQAPTGGGSSPWQYGLEDNIYYNNGNVGIGTGSAQTPVQPLHVEGNGYFRDNVGIGTTTPDHPLHVVTNSGSAILGRTTDSGSTISGVYGESIRADTAAVRGMATGTGGKGVSGSAPDGTGVYGYTESTTHSGVYGYNEAATGDAVGVMGESLNSPTGRGVYGKADGTSGRGVVGQVTGASGYGVYGLAVGGTGVSGDSQTGNGVSGYTVGSGAAGVLGYNEAPSGDAVGVMGESPESPNGHGVYGRADGAYGRGVFGEVTDTSGYGVYGKAVGGVGVYGESGTGNGVSGFTVGSTAAAVVGYNEAGSGDAIAVKGSTQSPVGFGGYFEGRGYFSGSVGIGTTTPQTKVEVVGAIQANAHKYRTPQERHLGVTGCAFVPHGEEVGFNKTSDGTLYGPYLEYARFYAPIYLPDGAFITQMTAYAADYDSDNNIEIALWAREWGFPSVPFDPLIAMTTMGDTGDQTPWETVNVTIDNDSMTYYLTALSEAWGGKWLHSVVLTYTVDQTD
jgi:hypothetical protein